MRTSSIRVSSVSSLMLLSMLSVCRPAVAQNGVINGIVKDARGNPIEGARIKLVCEGVPEKNLIAITDEDGAYRFADRESGKCQVSAERSGYSTAVATVLITPAETSEKANFTLMPAPGDSAASSQSRPNFEAAGVRGLIDPGGYSASANAAASTGLVSGIADIRRADNVTEHSSAKELPCTLEPELKKAVSTNPRSAEANRRLGEFYLAHRSPGQAIPYLERAHQIDGLNSSATLDLSEALLVNGRFDSARELLLTLNPNQEGVTFNHLLARADEGTAHFDQAANQYRIASEKEQDAGDIFGIGYELILDGRPVEAVKAFSDGMARYPSSITLVIGAGTAEFLQGHNSAAIDLFLQAADMNPADPRPYPFLAEALTVSSEQRERVKASLDRHLKISAGDGTAYYAYALLLSRNREHGAAVDDARVLEMLKQAIALNPKFAKAHFQLGSLYSGREDFKSAASEFEMTLGLAPDMKEAHYQLALAYRKMGRTEKADQEMKLFLHARDSSSAGAPQRTISIEQFLSVMDPPTQPHAGEDTQCRVGANSNPSSDSAHP
jgi:tetratricopeptide (TPR) repeat protein